jgi:hypothetical protein
MTTNGQTFKVGDEVRVSGNGWCDAKGIIQHLDQSSFRALVLRNGGNNPAWIPATSLTLCSASK